MLPGERLVADAFVDGAVGCLYAYAGWRLTRRTVEPGARRAQRMFGLWWYALGATGFAAVADSLLAFAVRPEVLAWVGLVSTATFCVAMTGLVTYLVYLFSGRDGRWPVAALYAAYFALQAYASLASPAASVTVQGWRPSLQPPAPAWTTSLGVAFLLLPQVGGALAYASLYRKVAEGPQRRRLVLVSASILLWSMGVVSISQPILLPTDAGQAAARALVLGSGALLLIASHARPRRHDPGAARAALQARVRALV